MRRVVIVIALAFSALNLRDLPAQPMRWKVIAPSLLSPYIAPSTGGPQTGVIRIHNSVILAGWKNLVLSTDLGATWQQVPLPVGNSYIIDIDMYDDRTFAVITGTKGVFYSSDQGATWSMVQSTESGFSVVFDNAADKLVATTYDSIYDITVNAATQANGAPKQYNYGCLARTADGSLRLLMSYASPPIYNCYYYYRPAGGAIWTLVNSLFQNDGDNFSVVCDPNDAGRVFVVHEDWALSQQGRSEIFVSSPGIAGWSVPYSRPLGKYTDLMGSGSIGCHDYFVGAHLNGILRSADFGFSWRSTGGPETAVDSKSIAAVDNAAIFVIDSSGTIWKSNPTILPDSDFVTGDQFLDNVSIATCDTTFDVTLYFEGICESHPISSVSIIGPDSTDYLITQNLSGTHLLPDSVRIRCAPSHSGISQATIVVKFPDGRSRTLPITVNVPKPALSFSPTALFARDTIAECDSATDSIIFHVNCPLTVAGILLTGPDSESFAAKGDIASLPGDSLLHIICVPKHPGQLHASLHITLTDGRAYDVPISPFIDASPVSITPASLFANDTLYPCSLLGDTIHIRSRCAGLSFSSISITGFDTSSFTLTASSSVTGDSILIVTARPTRIGKLQAAVTVVSSDGRIWTIPIEPYIKSPPLETSPVSLFAGDTIPLCALSSDTLRCSSPCPLDLSIISFSGVDAASFRLAGKASASLPADSLLAIACIPKHTGMLSASVVLNAADGRSWQVPVSVFVVPSPTVSISSQDISFSLQKEIGGDVRIHIPVHRSSAASAIECTIHYDDHALIYQGAFAADGQELSVGHPSKTSARVSLNAAADTAFDAVFSFYPVDSACTTITVDSLTQAASSANCIDVLSSSASVTVCLSGCGITTLARFVRLDEMPKLLVVPNPSSANVRIVSDKKITCAHIEIVDRFGIVKQIISGATIATDGLEIDTTNLGSGVYEAVVGNSELSVQTRFVLVR